MVAVFLALGAVIDRWSSNTCAEIYRLEVEKKARLLADFLGQALALDDDLLMVKTMSAIGRSGMTDGVVYDLTGLPLFSSQPTAAAALPPPPAGQLETAKSDPAYLSWASRDGVATAADKAVLTLAIHDGRLLRGILVLGVPMTSPRILPPAQRFRLHLPLFFGMLASLLIMVTSFGFERHRWEKTAAPAGPGAGVSNASESAAPEPDQTTTNLSLPPQLLEKYWSAEDDCALLLQDNRVIAASRRALAEFGPLQGRHLLELEGLLPNGAAQKVAGGEVENLKAIHPRGRQLELKVYAEGITRLLLFH